jgi:hypothetical protein
MPQTPTELLLRRMRKRQGHLKSGRYGIPVPRQCYQGTDYRFYACRIPLPPAASRLPLSTPLFHHRFPLPLADMWFIRDEEDGPTKKRHKREPTKRYEMPLDPGLAQLPLVLVDLQQQRQRQARKVKGKVPSSCLHPTYRQPMTSSQKRALKGKA